MLVESILIYLATSSVTLTYGIETMEVKVDLVCDNFISIFWSTDNFATSTTVLSAANPDGTRSTALTNHANTIFTPPKHATIRMGCWDVGGNRYLYGSLTIDGTQYTVSATNTDFEYIGFEQTCHDPTVCASGRLCMKDVPDTLTNLDSIPPPTPGDALTAYEYGVWPAAETSKCGIFWVDLIPYDQPPQCLTKNTKTFNWDTLTSDGIDIPVVDKQTFTMRIEDSDLSLNIEVDVEYIVRAYADDQINPNFGTTYVLDFEDFDAHKSSIALPSSCSNRLASDYNGDSNTYFTINSENIDAIGTIDNMCYPPPGDASTGWSINSDEMCTTVKYIGKWTWGELRECTNGGGFGGKQTFILDETDPDYDPKYISLAGTFYINMISPFWYKNYPGQLTNYYRVYQLVSQPWIIQVSKSVYVIGHTGINVMTMSIIAVYKENEDNDYTLILLTETAEYMMLQAPNLMEPLTIAGTQLNMLTNAETGTGNEACLNNKAYLCSQLWKIEAIGVICDTDFIDGGGIVFSDMYKIKFEPICRTNNGNTQYDEYTHCTNWLQKHPKFDINNVGEYKGVVLQSDLVFVDKICKAKIFTVQLKAEMKFYEEPNIETGVIEFGTVITPGSDYLYQVGESTIYVEIDLNFPTDTEAIFGSTLVNVWLCTFPPSDGTVTRTPPDQTGPTDPIDEATNGGCFSAERDGFVDGDDSDFFFHIFSSQTGIETDDFVLNDDGVLNSNIITFTFKCPHAIQRDTLYVHAQVEVELEELLESARRRMLLNVESDNKRTANKFAHFGKNIGITNKPNNNKPKQPQIPPQEPISPIEPIQQPPLTQPFTISLSSTWIIIIGALLSIILLCNIIYMCYMNCCKGNNGRGVTNLFNKNRRSGYRSVKNVDSEEFDISDANIINM